MASFIARVLGAARLDRGTYEEVERDTGATSQALAVVLLASAGVGFGLGWTGASPLYLWTIAILTATALVGWVTLALLTYLIGTRFFSEQQTRSDPGELLRTLGFSQSPGLLLPLALIPGLSGIVAGVIAVWMLAAMVVAVRQALDYKSTLRALTVCMAGWTAALAMVWVVAVFYATPVS